MKIMRSVVAAAMAAGVLAVVVSSSRAQPLSLKMASTLPAEHSSTKAMETVFKAELARRSHNTIDVELAPGEQLGSGSDIVQKLRADSIFAIWIGVGFFARLVPEIEAVNLPFVFKNYDDAMRTIAGPVGKLIEARLDAKGFTTLAWMELGARNVTNAKRPLKTLGDFRDLKIRVQPSETFMATFRALGAVPRVINTTDIHMALQQGDIDALDITYSLVQGLRYYEEQKYVSDTNHMLDLVVLVANKQAFMELTPQQREMIRGAARVTALQQRRMADAGEAAALTELKAKGLQFDPLPSETRIAFRKATAGVIDGVRKRIGAELVDRVIAEADRNRKPR